MEIRRADKKFRFAKILLLMPAFVFISQFLSAQPEKTPPSPFVQTDNLYKWGSISSFHGLPSEKVNSIAQTNEGIIWFGTEKGLAKFDGRRVQTITSQNLSALRILVVKVAVDGTLWIGTENGGFYYKDDVLTVVPETNGFLINSIAFDLFGDLVYLGSESGQIFRVIKDKSQSVTITVLPPADIDLKDLILTDGKLFVGTHKRGLLRFEDQSFSDVATKPKQNFINRFARDSSGQIWIGTQTFTENSGLYHAKTLTEWEKIDAAVGTVTSLSFDTYGNLWVGTKDRGAFLFKDGVQKDRFTFENTAGGLRSNEILSTFVDRENVVWFGTTKGVCRFDQTSPNNEKLSDDVQSNFVRTLYSSNDGELFAGTNRGLFSKQTDGTWKPIPGAENGAIYSVHEGFDGKLLFGTANGRLKSFDRTSKIISTESAADEDSFGENVSVRSIVEFKSKTYLGIFGRGLSLFENQEIGLPAQPEKLSQILTLSPQGNDILWIGTANNGVYTYDGETVAQDTRFDPLKNIAVWSIATSANGTVWFATETGLFYIHGGELKKILNGIDVRSVKVTKDATDTNESIWCATVNGMIQLTEDETFGWISTRTDVEQGLSSQSTFSLLPLFRGNAIDSMLIGTNRGVTNYRIQRTRPLVIPTRILSKRLHSASEMRDGISLEYPQNSLAVEVAALSSRTFPEQFLYAFVLRNSNNEILNKKLSNDSQFLMENLNSGVYTVEIKAFDRNLTASEPLVFSFSIASAPFPWTTLALTVLLVFAIIALIWAIFSQRRTSRTSTQLAVANKELSSARLDLVNEAERERRRISRDLHDQTLADLRHLMLLTDKLPIEDDSSDKAAIFRAEIEHVSNEIRNICEDLSPSVLENIGFTAALEWALSSAVRDSSKIITYEFVSAENTEERLNLSPTVQIQLYRIAQEILSNIVQHSNATHVSVHIGKSENGAFVLTIEDNGQGFDFENLRNVKGRGLANIQARANLIDAELKWSKSSSGDTVFKLSKVL